jgi:hypothetical protein
MKTKLTLLAVNGGAFNCHPSRDVELDDERIACNNVILPWEFNPHKCRLWVIGNEFGAVGAVWADCEQDAFDELVDQGMGDSFLVSEEDQADASEEEKEDWAYLGNAGEPCDLANAWIQPVRLSEPEDCRLLCLFAEARGACMETLFS